MANRFVQLLWFILMKCSAGKVMEWLRSMGGRAQGLELARFTGMGRGLKCTDRVFSESVVLHVPVELIFSGQSGNSLASQFEVTPSLSDSEAIAFQLVFERAKGEISNWAPYISVLPRSAVVTPKGFGQSALEGLQDRTFVERGLTARHFCEASFSRIRGRLIPAVRYACQTSGVHHVSACVEAHASLKAWAWALSLTDSRALTFKGARYLIPVADLINYAPHPSASTRTFASGEFFLEHHLLSLNGIEVLSDRTCEPGSQFFEDYGDNPTSIYVEHHGLLNVAV